MPFFEGRSWRPLRSRKPPRTSFSSTPAGWPGFPGRYAPPLNLCKFLPRWHVPSRTAADLSVKCGWACGPSRTRSLHPETSGPRQAAAGRGPPALLSPFSASAWKETSALWLSSRELLPHGPGARRTRRHTPVPPPYPHNLFFSYAHSSRTITRVQHSVPRRARAARVSLSYLHGKAGGHDGHRPEPLLRAGHIRRPPPLQAKWQALNSHFHQPSALVAAVSSGQTIGICT